MTTLSLADLGCPPLSRDVRTSLERTRSGHTRYKGQGPSAATIFGHAMRDVTAAIEDQRRFTLLKRFVYYGSLLPSWERNFTNGPHAVDDRELAQCINFLSDHVVSKFQGKIAELLASMRIAVLVAQLKERRIVPDEGELVFGEVIRCRPKSRRGGVATPRTVEGPDAAVFVRGLGGRFQVAMVAEVKSAYRAPAELERQSAKHVRALANGVQVRGRWYERCDSTKDLVAVYVCPSSWPLPQGFRLVADRDGVKQIVMEQQDLPLREDECEQLGDRLWRITLAWSWHALRAAAFSVAHRYMGTIGEALAEDADKTLRSDMPPAEAGRNDFLAQLHVAIFRQLEAERDPRKQAKTIELYNVLGFGWALGHHFRDSKGTCSMMFFEDIEEMLATRVSTPQF